MFTTDPPLRRRPAWPALLPLLALLSCSWPLDNPVDPHRCAQGCPPGQRCHDGQCVAGDGGVPVKPCTQTSQCDDKLVCTKDSCVNELCVNTPSSNECAISGTCMVAGARKHAESCAACVPSTAPRAWTIKARCMETVAGGGSTKECPPAARKEGAALSARFINLNDVAVASDGTVYAVELKSKKLRIIKNGKVGAVAQSFTSPSCVTVDRGNGDQVYVGDNRSIYRVDKSGKTTLFAGGGTCSGKKCLALDTRFGHLVDLEVGRKTGALYVLTRDGDNTRVSKITGGDVLIVAQDPSKFHRKYDGKEALLYSLAVDPAEQKIYVSDYNHHKIWRIDTAKGGITLFAGTGKSGSMDGPAATATITAPRDLAVDSKGRLYIAGYSDVRFVQSKGSNWFVSTYVSSDTLSATVPGKVWMVYGLDVDAKDRLYLADRGYCRIRVIYP